VSRESWKESLLLRVRSGSVAEWRGRMRGADGEVEDIGVFVVHRIRRRDGKREDLPQGHRGKRRNDEVQRLIAEKDGHGVQGGEE
jgi:hypothetical protein